MENKVNERLQIGLTAPVHLFRGKKARRALFFPLQLTPRAAFTVVKIKTGVRASERAGQRKENTLRAFTVQCSSETNVGKIRERERKKFAAQYRVTK